MWHAMKTTISCELFIYELVVHTQYLLDRYIYTRIKKQVELNLFIDNIHNKCIYVQILIVVKLD